MIKESVNQFWHRATNGSSPSGGNNYHPLNWLLCNKGVLAAYVHLPWYTAETLYKTAYVYRSADYTDHRFWSPKRLPSGLQAATVRVQYGVVVAVILDVVVVGNFYDCFIVESRVTSAWQVSYMVCHTFRKHPVLSPCLEKIVYWGLLLFFWLQHLGLQMIHISFLSVSQPGVFQDNVHDFQL